jgi:D-alanyl-D-alanine carboxypeptidase
MTLLTQGVTSLSSRLGRAEEVRGLARRTGSGSLSIKMRFAWRDVRRSHESPGQMACRQDVASLSRALEQAAVDRGPGLFALVADAGTLVFAGGVGTADLQDPRPLRASDRFRIASATKMFTATVVLKLAATRRLRLDDRAVSWLPSPVLSLQPPDWPATVWQLLAMRSGPPDYVRAVLGDPPSLAGLHRDYLPGELVSIAVAQPGAARPGETWRYSNTDYILLGLIIEQVTGQRGRRRPSRSP